MITVSAMIDPVNEPSTSEAHAPPAGWLLVADQPTLDVEVMLRRFGQVYRYPVGDNDEARLLDAGQPCFLVRTDRSKVIGIWAIGEAVAPCLALDPALEHPAAGRAEPLDPDGRQLHAEVELLPLQKPLALTKLLDDDVLGPGALATATERRGLVPLSRREVRAIESFDFWIEEPTDDQRRALDELLELEEATQP